MSFAVVVALASWLHGGGIDHGRTVALLVNTGSPRLPLDTVMKAAN
jgi:hypothetical protein